MTVTATITRRRKARTDSAWEFNITTEDVVVKGDVRVASTVDDSGYERAGWRAVDIVEAIVGSLTDLPVAINYVGLPPHPAAAKTEPPETE